MEVADLQAATFAGMLARLREHPVEVKGMISLGAGRGRDMKFFARTWPEAATLLIDMDPQFEADYRELQSYDARVRYDICGAAAEDRVGYQLKTTQFGGTIVTEPTNEDPDQLVKTPFKRLDTLIKEHGIPGPYFLKFDTHGAELDILSGAEQVLAETSLIMMECYNFKMAFTGGKNLTFDEMSLHMRTLGFRIIDMCDPLYRPADAALWQVHLFFAREDHPSFRSNSFGRPKA